MALTGIGSLKHHVLSTKRAGFIFIFIVQTIKPGADVKQNPFDIRKSENNTRFGTCGLMSCFLTHHNPDMLSSSEERYGYMRVTVKLGLQKLIFFLMILLWPQTWVYVLDSLNHRRLTTSQAGTGRGSFTAFSGFLWEDGPSLNGTHVPKSVSLYPTSLSPSLSLSLSLSKDSSKCSILFQ